MNALIILAGAVIAIAGRHSVPALIIGFGLLAIGWCRMEVRR